MESRSRPLLALLLLIPAPSIGVLANGILAESNTAFLAFIGLTIWALCKVWIFGFPVIWHTRIDGGERGYSLLPEGSGIRPWIEGLGLGLALSVIVVITFLITKPYLDIESIGASIRAVGLDSWSMLIPAILFWVFINSVVEEYVYRWFLTEQASTIFNGEPIKSGTISVLSFTLHHIVAVALVAETCFPFTVIPTLMNEYKAKSRKHLDAHKISDASEYHGCAHTGTRNLCADWCSKDVFFSF